MLYMLDLMAQTWSVTDHLEACFNIPTKRQLGPGLFQSSWKQKGKHLLEKY